MSVIPLLRLFCSVQPLGAAPIASLSNPPFTQSGACEWPTCSSSAAGAATELESPKHPPRASETRSGSTTNADRAKWVRVGLPEPVERRVLDMENLPKGLHV